MKRNLIKMKIQKMKLNNKCLKMILKTNKCKSNSLTVKLIKMILIKIIKNLKARNKFKQLIISLNSLMSHLKMMMSKKRSNLKNLNQNNLIMYNWNQIYKIPQNNLI